MLNNKKEKICHLTSAHPWNDIRIFHKECRSLAQIGLNVSLIAFDATNSFVDRVQIINAGIKPKGRFSRMINGSKIIYKIACKTDADIYHLHDPELLIVGRKLMRQGKKVIYDAHEDLPMQVMGKHWIPKLFRKFVSSITAILLKFFLKNISGIVAATPIIANKLSKWNSNTIIVCNYPLLTETPQININTKENSIYYIGGLFQSRGLFQMLDAVKNISVTLELAGNFSPETLSIKANQHPSWQKVKFHGFINRSEVYNLMLQSKAGLVVLSPLQSYIDSLPIKMFEYMLAELPVIASNFPLWKEIVEGNNCGLCVDPESPDEIAKAINFIIANDDLAKQMGQNGRKAIIEKYNWKNEEKKLLEFYKSF